MKVKVGVSARHVHLTEEDYNLLFDEKMNIKRRLYQPSEYASDKKVTISNGKKKLKATVLGPFRKYTQVEISETNAHYLELSPPVKTSGDLEGAEEITISTRKGSIKRKACILATRHIHVNNEERKKYNLTKDTYQVKVSGDKGGILDNVKISEGENFVFEMHLDTDDANAFLIKDNDELEIIE